MLGKTFVPRLNPKDSRRVVTLLDAGYELAISLNPVTTPGTVDRAILQDGDLCNPVLQYTPSRSQINGREGRKLEVRADTFVEDIFSILVFRNILFNTAYMKARFLPGTCRTFAFTSLEGFRNQLKYVSIYVEPSRVEEFFCNQNAFGQQHATPRHVQDCRLLWDVATSSDIYALHSFVGAPAPFAVVLQLLRHLHDSRGLLGMGLRGVYLTTVDLCLAGLTHLPSPTEMGSIIHEYSPGAKAGLAAFGLLHAEADSVEEVEIAFMLFYRGVKDKLGVKKVDLYEWTTVSAEHALCSIDKLSRYV